MPGSARERLLMRTNHLFGCPFTRIPSRGECICPALDDVVAIEAEAVAAERARLREVVEGIQVAASLMERHAANDPLVLVRVSRETFRDLIVQPLAAVLAALEGPDAR